MQTFLTDRNFDITAERLDFRRLNKQITECYQLLNAIRFGTGWKHHPAADMWRGAESYLFAYSRAMFSNFVARGGSATHKSWQKIMCDHVEVVDTLQPPPWWHKHDELYSSHRGRLLHKGNIDALRPRLVDYGALDVDEYITLFFKSKKKMALRDLTIGQVNELTDLMDTVGVPKVDNWYDQWGWSEQPSDTYIWPKDLTTA